MHESSRDPAYFKHLAATLRTLVCFSSGTEGLLWRVCSELSVSDVIPLVAQLAIDPDHPQARSMQFCLMPVSRPQDMPPVLQSRTELLSLREVLKTYEAVYLPTVARPRLTHESLIKAVAQQIGTSHEDDGLDPDLVKLLSINLGGETPHEQLLKRYADLTLQVGERALDCAASDIEYVRKRRRRDHVTDHGDVTVTMRLIRRETIVGEFLLLRLESAISECVLEVRVRPETIQSTVLKRGVVVWSIDCGHPTDWTLESDALFGLNFSSSENRVRLAVNGVVQDEGDCSAGWIDGSELRPVHALCGPENPVQVAQLMVHSRHLSLHELRELHSFSRDYRELFKRADPDGQDASQRTARLAPDRFGASRRFLRRH